MVVTTRAIEDEVTTLHLTRRNLLTLLVLITGVVRQRNTHAGKGIEHEARAIEADLVVVAVGVSDTTVANALGRAIGIATTPCVGNANLRSGALDDGFDLRLTGGIPEL